MLSLTISRHVKLMLYLLKEYNLLFDDLSSILTECAGVQVLMNVQYYGRKMRILLT